MASASTRFIRRLARLTLALSAVVVSSAVTAPAQAAPTVVTACGRDDAAGGVNLVQALAAGGEIVIRCAPGQGIRITTTRVIQAGTSIDGEGRAILTGTLKGPLFTVGLGSVTLRNLRIAAPRDASTIPSANAGIIVEARNGSILLENVHSEDARNAYSAIRFTARNSRFVNIGDGAPGRAPGFVIDAEKVELRGVEVTGGTDHPLGGGEAPLPGRSAFARSILIEDSQFANNRNGLLVSDAVLTIRRTRFIGNGELASSSSYWGCCAGALTLVHSKAQLTGVTFQSNKSTGFGGAILALGSWLRLSDTIFERNSARVGGAIVAWERPPINHSWGAVAPGAPILSMTRTRFLANAASAFGGGLVFAGTAEGQAVLFSRNKAPSGAAIASWRSASLPPPHQQVLGALEQATVPVIDTLSLARPVFTDNEAQRGAAILGASADVRIGNALVVRNGLANASATGAVLIGERLSIANSSIVDNWAPGLALGSPAQVRLVNSILTGNRGGNCVPTGTPVLVGPNLQFPGQSCGSAVPSTNPGLGGDYAPGPFSAARGTGDIGTCVADPFVRGVDVYGNARLNGGRCDLGAIERDVLSNLSKGLPFGLDRPESRTCLIILLTTIIVIILLLIFVIVWRRRRRTRRCVKELADAGRANSSIG